jgi:hypothetical protein
VVKESLTTDKIIIEEIFLDGPVVSYEKKGNTDNFKAILANIKQTVASEKKEDKAGDAPTDTGSEKTIQINNFIVRNGRINLGGSLLDTFGSEKGLGIPMPDIHMKDIGKGKQTTPAEAFAMILAEMTGDIAGTVTQAAKQISEALGKAMEGAASGAGSVGSAVKGLFGSQ